MCAAELVERDPEKLVAAHGVEVRRLGTVGGDELLGSSLAELGRAYEGLAV